MPRTRLALAAVLSLTLLGAGSALAASRGPDGGGGGRLSSYAESFRQVDRTTGWQLTRRTRLDFPTYHPQGFALVGDRIFMSAVEVTEPPVKYPSPRDGSDRSTGRGVGHLIVMTREGELVEDVRLGEGSVYHPGGIDYDGHDVWVPVAEYRPHSRSIVYRVDPSTLVATEAFRHADHVGGVVRDRRTGRVHGVSWGSRSLFTWRPDGRLVASAANPDHVLDYQDCAYSGAGTQLCSGITGLASPTGIPYELGGLALTSLTDDRVLHEVPVPLFSAAGHVITRNPVALEQARGTLRMFAAPDDGNEGLGTELLVYETTVGR